MYADLYQARFDDARLNRTRFHRALSDDLNLKRRAGALEKDPELYEAELWSETQRARAFP